jgi:DNA-binding NtrC family response regulator
MVAPMILIVDDDKLTRWSVSKILGSAGYRTCEAGSLAEGASAVERQQPNLILLDIRLPDGDGFSLLKAIQASYPDLPVIMMTAHPSQDTVLAAESLGASGHLSKPCTPEKLQEAVTRALGSRLSARPESA